MFMYEYQRSQLEQMLTYKGGNSKFKLCNLDKRGFIVNITYTLVLIVLRF